MSTNDSDLITASEQGCIVIRRNPSPDVDQRVSFPDGSVAERLAADLPDGPLIPRIRWRVTQGENMASQWVKAERQSMERAQVEFRRRAPISLASDVRLAAWPEHPIQTNGYRVEIDGPVVVEPEPAPRLRMRPEVEQQIADRQAAAPVAAEPPADLAALLASIESEIVDAGERCCPDYQQLDWDVLTACYENVKRLVREFVERSPDDREHVDALRGLHNAPPPVITSRSVTVHVPEDVNPRTLEGVTWSVEMTAGAHLRNMGEPEPVRCAVSLRGTLDHAEGTSVSLSLDEPCAELLALPPGTPVEIVVEFVETVAPASP